MQFNVILGLVVIEALVIIFLFVDNRRRRRREWLGRVHSLESLLSEFSASLSSANPNRLDAVIEEYMSRVLDIVGAGRVCWYITREHRAELERIYSVHKPGVDASPELVSRDNIPFVFDRLMLGTPHVMHAPEDMPPEAQQDRDFFQAGSIRGLVLLASDCGTRHKGVLGVAYIPAEIQWTEELLKQLNVFNNLIVTSVERKSVFEMLNESEKRFRCLFQTAPIGIALEDFDGTLLFVNPALCSMLGYEDMRGMRCEDFSVPDAEGKEEHLFQELREGTTAFYTLEKQFIKRDGTLIWGRIDVSLLNDGSSEPELVVGMVEDITQRKTGDEELRRTRSELEQLAAYLIQTQEDERHRISRELHDDIGQRLSLLAIEFDLLSQSLASSGRNKHPDRVTAIKAQLDELTSDVHQLSHQLHSAKLQHLGLRSAVEELARQIAKQHQIAITLHTGEEDNTLPPDVALCLFRVTQEALSNVVRHSKAESVSVDVNLSSGLAELTVQDSGVGFDLSASQGGLGLISMRERLRMIGGQFTVESLQGKGTSIRAWVPLKVDAAADKVA